MRTERTQNSHWSEVPHELISCKYLKVGYSRICACAGVLFMWGHTGSCHPLFVLGPVSFLAITRALFLSQVNLIQGVNKFPKYFERQSVK